ncbi:MAG: NAD(P)/FAD-dependent oxidoreductase [Burkholderiaceae bacterium]
MTLEELETLARSDLRRISHPGMRWSLPHQAPDGSAALDVLIVGGGQSGLATAIGLRRSMIDNVMVIDEAEYGREGPWLTYARMHTLRNPKDYTGPDLDVPSLTCQSWYEARFGARAWEELDALPRELWAEYLLWVRKVSGVEVRNGTRLVDLQPAADDLILATLVEHGRQHTVHARKVVLATGQESMGRWGYPAGVEALPQAFRARAADPIDFAALAGKDVLVIGAGASAFDNAAWALESGAGRVRLLCRRLEPQVIQPYRWLTFRGFLRHFSDLSDAWRWKFMNRILGLREGFTQQTYDRCMVHANFEIVSGAGVTGAHMADGKAVIETTAGPVSTDFVISGIGVEVDFSLRPELARFADNIARWQDRYVPPADEVNERLAPFPYLNADYSFAERTAGRTPWIRNIHLFSIASTMSFGPSGSSINAMTTAIPKLVAGLGSGLFTGDVERYWQSLDEYAVPQAILKPRSAYENASVGRAAAAPVK